MFKIAGTGHRPKYYQQGYSYSTRESQILYSTVYEYLEKLINYYGEKSILVISGGALGFDDILLLAAHNLNKSREDLDIKTELAAPMKNWYSVRPPAGRKQAEKFMALANEVTYVDELNDYMLPNSTSGKYQSGKEQMRNYYMADKADVTLALCSNVPSGTRNYLNYIQNKYPNKKIYNIWGVFEKRLNQSSINKGAI